MTPGAPLAVHEDEHFEFVYIVHDTGGNDDQQDMTS